MNTSAKTVLVVDDEADIRALLDAFLSVEGFRVLEADNGTKAFDMVKSKNIDAVISDVKMPGGDGVTLLKNVRALFPKVPVVVLITGYAELTPEEAGAHGAIKMLTKPIDFPLLIKTIKDKILP